MSWAVLLFLLVADATVLEVLLYKNSHHKGTCLHYYFQTVCLYYAYRLAYSILVADAEFFGQVLLGGECDDRVTETASIDMICCRPPFLS